MFFFFKQKTAYEMRISDWSSDVCSSDLSRSGGSITALYTVLADGDDTDDPIVDAARAIVDGHIVLSRQLSEQSIFPAIDVGKSLSRVMADVVSDQHRNAASAFRRLWAAYEIGRATSELQSLMRISYAVFCLKQKK